MRPLSEPLLLVACRLQVLLAVACRTNPKLQLPVCLIVAKSLRRDGGDDSCDFRGCNIESKRDFTSFVPNHLASSAERETERLRRGSHVVVAQTLVKHWSASEINPTATVLEEQESCCAPYALRRAQERPCLLKLSKTYKTSYGIHSWWTGKASAKPRQQNSEFATADVRNANFGVSAHSFCNRVGFLSTQFKATEVKDTSDVQQKLQALYSTTCNLPGTLP